MLSALRVAGRVRVPGDKSISHRALIFAALAPGRSRVRGILDSADVRATAAALRALGARVPVLGGADVQVEGGPLTTPSGALDCGNSGTTARLLAGVVAAHPFAARFVGDASLSRRPMRRVAAPLSAMGAEITFDHRDGRLPMRVSGGPLRAVEWTGETASAQVKSAVLLAGVLAGVAVTVREPHPSRDHTERMLTARGVDVRNDGTVVAVPPAQRIAALDVDVPGDPSSAAFFAALAALADHGELVLPDVCLNPTRTGFLALLTAMGAAVRVEDARWQGGEAVGTVRTTAGAGLRGTTVDAAAVPALVDELPLLAGVAACAQGDTVVRGAAELRVKESDRIAAVVAGLRAIGADADELPDGFVVHGRGPRSLAGRVVTHGDHRMAMTFGVLSALPGNTITVDDPGCVAVSYPRFWDDLARVAHLA